MIYAHFFETYSRSSYFSSHRYITGVLKLCSNSLVVWCQGDWGGDNHNFLSVDVRQAGNAVQGSVVNEYILDKVLQSVQSPLLKSEKNS